MSTQHDRIDFHVLRHEIAAARRLLLKAEDAELCEFHDAKATMAVMHNLRELIACWCTIDDSESDEPTIHITDGHLYSFAEAIVDIVVEEGVDLVQYEVLRTITGDQLDKLDDFAADVLAEQPAGRWNIGLEVQ